MPALKKPKVQTPEMKEAKLRLVKKEELGQRGKRAEKSVRDHFEKLNEQYATFCYERLPDARAAMGRIKKQMADYLCWWRDTDEVGDYDFRYQVPLEVKSTEHDYRLAKDKLEQLPKLKKVAMAGAFPHVLVHFKAIDKWRIAPADYFESGVPSWDMRDLPTFESAQAALESTGLFPKLKD